jgi:hypothetical protein
LCPTEKRAIAWIQSLLEQVYRGGEIWGQVRPALGYRVSWDPAEMEKTLKEIEKNLFGM